jgi:multidrug resistance efflux pump
MDSQSARDHLDDTVAGLKDKENDVKKKIVSNELSLTTFQQSLNVAKANLDKAKLDFQAMPIRTEVDKELVKLAVEEAEATYKELLTDLPRRQESLKCDLRISEIAKKTEDLHVARHQVDLERFTIKSPMDGMAVVMSQPRGGGDTMTYGEGDRVFPGATIVKIIDQKSMQVEAAINQSESSLFRLGQPAKVQLDAFPGAVYDAKIYAIGALAVSPGRQTNYLRTIPVRIQIVNPDAKVIPDLSASADVLVNKADNALIVPAGALRLENGKYYVQVRTGEGWERRVVLTGLTNGTQTVVTDGLKEGETIRASFD